MPQQIVLLLLIPQLGAVKVDVLEDLIQFVAVGFLNGMKGLVDGNVIETATLPADMHKNSIRHLAVGDQRQVAFGMQWQGDGPVETLVGIHQMGRPMRLMAAHENDVQDMQGYVGSIALSAHGRTIAVTSPRGGLMQEYDVREGVLSQSSAIPDVSGVVVLGQSIAVSSGTGDMMLINAGDPPLINRTSVQWDNNHLIPITAA